jgi:hypothetical protein
MELEGETVFFFPDALVARYRDRVRGLLGKDRNLPWQILCHHFVLVRRIVLLAILEHIDLLLQLLRKLSQLLPRSYSDAFDYRVTEATDPAFLSIIVFKHQNYWKRALKSQ